MDLDVIVRDVIDDNRYMTIATADAHGDPGVSPVYFAADDYRDFYWMSSPEVTHSRDIAMRPQVSIVLFDSRAPTEAVPGRTAYLKAIAVQVNDDEIEHALTIYPGPIERGGIVTADEVRPPRRTASTARWSPNTSSSARDAKVKSARNTASRPTIGPGSCYRPHDRGARRPNAALPIAIPPETTLRYNATPNARTHPGTACCDATFIVDHTGAMRVRSYVRDSGSREQTDSFIVGEWRSA